MRLFSSRRTPLHTEVLEARLRDAVAYDRIAGYFRSSLFEVAGEALESVTGPIRIVCNSDLDPLDVATAAAAQGAIRRSWCRAHPELAPPSALPRYQRLYNALTSGKLEVRVLPEAAFGLVHGKAGVIRRGDGSATAFLGSVNESASAWTLNYELVWEDDSPEVVNWVQEEFLALWNDPRAMDLGCCPFIVQDLQRILSRQVVGVADFHAADVQRAAAAAAVETPVYRKEQGLWPHQKYFCQLALERHRLGGARLVLADQVGLGKTVQLAMAALLMAMDDPGGGPILVLAPKPLLRQWQAELMELLQMPSARWNGRGWVDEHEVEHGVEGIRSLGNCPRRIGLVSQGLITRGMKDPQAQLLSRRYTCVIVDEAHRARRRDLPAIDARADELDVSPVGNNLMDFLLRIGTRTKSLLLATATPVQVHPLEAWDLLRILSEGNDGVLGGRTHSSPWYQPSRCLAVAQGQDPIPDTPQDGWPYVRDPLPAAAEDPAFSKIRRALNADDRQWQFPPESLNRLPPAVRQVLLVNGLLPEYAARFNPLLRCIVRRTRGYLESTINPATGGYYLPRVAVRLFGEDDAGALTLGGYLLDAYHEAESFCRLLQQRVKGAGFFKTLLLRRLGSSMEAGRRTVTKLLNHEAREVDEDEEDDPGEDEETGEGRRSRRDLERELRDYTPEEVLALRRCLELLKQGRNRDPKLEAVLGYLLGTRDDSEGRWLEAGCILFSQYYDTVRWVGEELARHEAFSEQDIGLYAGTNRSGFWRHGRFQRCERDTLKVRVRDGSLRILLGTDAASEGLNLQRLGTLINIDLPWNPTRLEQRKGRIQRIGQARSEVWIANLRYRDSVEDRVHAVLADRLEAIHGLFGQIPDTLEDVWVQLALDNEQAARQLIDRTAQSRNPFDAKYSKVTDADWETSNLVIDPSEVREELKRGW